MPLSSRTVNTFVSPTRRDIDPNIVRGNDNTLRVAFNAHDADPSIHVQSGTLANRPISSADGSTYYATDTGDTYSMVAGTWVLSAWAHWYGDIYDTTDQPITTINTQQVVTFDSTGIARGVALVSGSQFRVTYAGDYNVMFSAQVKNTDAAEHNVSFWWKKNGTNIADSAGQITMPKKHGSGDGHMIAMWNIYVTLAANDYVQLYWQAPSTLVSLETIPAVGSIPRSPSVIATINRI